MVDFSNEVTVSTPAVDVMRILILEARHNLLESIETYYQRKADGHSVPTSLMKSRLWRLFNEIEPTIKRQFPDKQEAVFKELESFVNDFAKKDAEDIIKYAQMILTILDTVQLTRIDTKQKLGGNIIDRNKHQGWQS